MIINKLSLCFFFFLKKWWSREIQLLAPPSPSLTHRLSSEIRLDEHTTTLKRKWHEKKIKRVRKQNGERRTTVEIYCTSLWFPFLTTTPSLPPKPWPQGAPQLDHTDLEEPIATTKHKGHELLRTPLPSSFRKKRPPYLSHPHNSKVKAPWWMLENSGTLFLLIQESCLDYTFMYNTSVTYNTSEQRNSFPKVCMSRTQLPLVSLHGKILWLNSRQSNITVHIWNPCRLWKILQELKQRSLPKMRLRDF